MPAMAVPVTEEQLKRLQEKRAAAIKAAGTHWLLHPANAVQRKTPTPRWMVLGFLAFILLGGVGNDDMDGRVRIEPQLSGAP